MTIFGSLAPATLSLPYTVDTNNLQVTGTPDTALDVCNKSYVDNILQYPNVKYNDYKKSYKYILSSPSVWISGPFPEAFTIDTDYYNDSKTVVPYNFANGSNNVSRTGTILRNKDTINSRDYYCLHFSEGQQLTGLWNNTDFDVTQVDGRTSTNVGTATVKTGYTIIAIMRKMNGKSGRAVGSLQNNAPLGYWNAYEDVAWVNENIYGVDPAERRAITTVMHCYILRVTAAGVCDFWDFNRSNRTGKTVTNPAYGTLAIGLDYYTNECGTFNLYELWMWKTALSDAQLTQIKGFISTHYPFP